MNITLKIIIFLLSNLLGCFMAALLFVLILVTGIIDLKAPNFDALAFREWFVVRVMLSWVVCAIFSFSAFFIGGYWRFVFLLAPVIVPFLYGLALLATVHPQ